MDHKSNNTLSIPSIFLAAMILMGAVLAQPLPASGA